MASWSLGTGAETQAIAEVYGVDGAGLDDRTAARHQRAKDLAKAHDALWTIKRRLSRPAYRDRRLVERKLAEAVGKVVPYLRVTIVDTEHGLDVR